jgi:hypothetical protein
MQFPKLNPAASLNAFAEITCGFRFLVASSLVSWHVLYQDETTQHVLF